ncbi:MAG: hypothetical protein LBC61_06720 [Candidatus Peribacteria bacterium]|jgi:hypothetical protein|nr:hypothetical protein [Candidatus Peribacteria bacterium]
MTKVTMDTLMVMLYDALRINDRRIEEAKRIRASEEKKFNRYLRIIKLANDSRIGERNNSNNLSRIKVKGGGFSHK